MSDELVELMKKPEAMLNNAISTVGKKTAASLWVSFKRMLATASDPFFRKDMGERYFSLENQFSGIVVWIIGTLASCGMHAIGGGSQNKTAVLLTTACLGTGFALVALHWIWGRESLSKMRQFREQGEAYHSMSRGTLRWGNSSIVILMVATLVLLICNLFSAIFLVISYAMSAKLAAEQDAAIYGRYLDALDAQIEKEFLEKAILGKCPAEVTQLNKPLPADMNADLRENIAAAAVGKPVKIFAGKPRTGAPTPTANPTVI